MKIKLLLTILILPSLAALVLGGCASASRPALQDKPTVYTSIYPLYDFTKKIAGDKLIVLNAIPLGAQSHSLEPSAKTAAEMSRAKLFIINGAGMEHYAAKLVPTLQSSGVKILDTSEGIALLQSSEAGLHEEEADEHDSHGAFDPHIWLSPKKALLQVQAIYQALVSIDPVNSDYYQSNYSILLKELSQLDQDYSSTLETCPQKEFIVSHAAFHYLADDYGLRQIPVLGINAEAEPGPATLKEIIQYMRENKFKVLFWDPLDSPKVAQTISSETGAEMLPLNSLGALGDQEIQSGQDYFSIMRTNLANLKKGLGQ